MASGLYVTPDGEVMVAYGSRNIPISLAHYRANGYKPAVEKLMRQRSGGDRLWSAPRHSKANKIKGLDSGH
jgi:hypothetical protein